MRAGAGRAVLDHWGCQFTATAAAFCFPGDFSIITGPTIPKRAGAAAKPFCLAPPDGTLTAQLWFGPAVCSSPADFKWRFFLPALLCFKLPAVSMRLHRSFQPLALGPILRSVKGCRAVPVPTGCISLWVLLSPPTLSSFFATHSTFPDSALSPSLLRIPPPLPPSTPPSPNQVLSSSRL